MSEKDSDNTVARKDQQREPIEDDKSGTSGEANWQKEMDLDWAHASETERPHYQTGINVEPAW